MNATNLYPRTASGNRPPARRFKRGGTKGLGAKGLGVAELLISLAISATVLAAVAYAVDMTFRAYSINHEQADLMQRSRVALYRMTTTIRTTGDHQPITALALADFKNGKVTTDTGITMHDVNDQEVVFKFDPAKSRLVAVDGLGTEYTLLRGVEKFEVKFEPLLSQEAKRAGAVVYDRLMRATILLTVRTTGNSADVDEKVGSQSVTLSTSVMPRRNAW
jgi:Tfp pilus assembly protein PilW